MLRNSEYWHIAGSYALGFGAMGLVASFLTQYLLGQGFSGTDIGLINAVRSFLGLLLIPLISTLADHTGRHRRILFTAILLQACVTVGIISQGNVAVVGASVVLFYFAVGLGMTLRNRLSLHWLDGQGSSDFGSLRLWGSVGFAIVTLIGGTMAGWTGVEFLIVFSGGLILMSIPLLRPYKSQLPVQEARPTRRRGSLSLAMQMILVVVFLRALSVTAYSGWVNDFVENDLGGGTMAVGQFVSFAAMAEVPMMWYAARLSRRWGTTALWSGSLLLLSFVWVAISMAQTASQAVLLGVVAGAVQAPMLVAPVVLIGQISKPHNAALNLALMGTFAGLGTLLGSPVAGRLFDTIGVRSLIQVGAGVQILAAVALVLLMQLLQWHNARVGAKQAGF